MVLEESHVEHVALAPIEIDTAILQANGDATSLQWQYVPLRSSIEIDLLKLAAVAVFNGIL